MFKVVGRLLHFVLMVHIAIVGGGENGEVVVYRTEDDATFYNLIGDQEADGTTELFACGQPGEFPDRTIVSARIAALAVGELLSGKPSSFVWEME